MKNCFSKFIFVYFISLSVFSQVKQDSIQTDSSSINLDDAIITGKYYEKYIEHEASQSLRLDESIIEIPQNVTVITELALVDQQVISMSDALVRNVSGAVRLEHWGDLYSRINMRGSRAAAFLNGVNITSNWGPLNEDMSYVDHIEFVKGPAGFLMSNGEPSGIYNIVTKQATGNDLNGSFRMTLGSFDMYRAEADVDTKVNDKLSVRFNLMGQNKKSFRDYEFNNRYIANTSIRYDFSDRTTFTAQYRYQKAKTSEVGSAYVFSFDGYGTFPVEYTISDPKLPRTNIDEHVLEGNLVHELNDDWKITAHFTYLNDYTMGGDVWPGSFDELGNMIRYFYYWEAINDQKFGQVFVNGNLETGSIKHKILAGLDLGDKKYTADWSQGFAMDSEENPFNIYNPTSMTMPIVLFDKSIPLESRPYASVLGQSYTGIYLQDEVRLFEENLRITIAARYTNAKNDTYGTISKAEKITPRIGLSYSFDSHTSIYGLYDQSFVPQSGLIQSGDEVKPITGNNMELGVKREWANGKWLSTLTVYRIVKENELTSDPFYEDPINNPYSIVLGKKRAAGVEFDIKGEILPGLNAILNYAFTENIVTESNVPGLEEGTREPGYAKHTTNAWLNYTLQNGILKGLGFSFGSTYLVDRSTWTWASTADQLDMDDYVKFDAGISWEYKNVKLNLNVFNVFDEYLYSGSAYSGYYYYQAEAPRNWRLSFGYNF